MTITRFGLWLVTMPTSRARVASDNITDGGFDGLMTNSAARSGSASFSSSVSENCQVWAPSASRPSATTSTMSKPKRGSRGISRYGVNAGTIRATLDPVGRTPFAFRESNR